MTTSRKRLSLRLTAAALTLLTAGTAFLAAAPVQAAAGNTVISSSRFDSKVYKKILADWDVDGSGDLTEFELARVTHLDLSDCSLS
ncbi:MAG: hypothetical protein PUC47_00545, partial [Oscillospiraceae bacterium]|nr:hypothetical protein [Oscillospiraceae bacterium]